ncbi:MAG: gliding motility-associated C-terminal domain-containing protein [Flavobacteriales bacterium]|nr:gliding motility-associated C-terminal domain-containing protein [Flavobacteriales bacterium]
MKKISFRLCVLAILFLVTHHLYSQVSFTTPGTYTWTVPPCVNTITVKVWGGGGGGGGAIAVVKNSAGDEACSGAGGGGGGGYSSSTFAVTPGQTYTIVVGAGGTGGSGGAGSWNSGVTTAPSIGATGGTSSFTGYSHNLIANGGTGGGPAGCYNTGSSGGTCASAQGTAGAGGNSSGGSVNNIGGNGAPGLILYNSTDKSGGGGGAAGPGGNGGNATLPGSVGIVNPPGGAGQAPGGKGGDGRVYNVPANKEYAGFNGLTYGGAGGGALIHRGSYGAGLAAGGNGADGAVLIEYTPTGTLPAQPSPITGTAILCDVNAGSYSVINVPGITYTWTYSGSATVTPSGNSVSLTNITSGGTLTVTPSNACGDGPSQSIVIQIATSPTAPISINGVGPYCEGSTITLTQNGGALTGSSVFQWYTGSCGGTPVGTGSSITVSPTTTTTYYVQATSNGPCPATACASGTVIINPAPTPSISGMTSICVGQSTTLTATGGGTYVWNTASTASNITVTPSSTTTYTVTVTGAGGCTATATKTVVVSPIPPPSITGITSICLGQSTTLTATGGGTYLWNTGATNTSITISPTVNTTYTVTITNAGGCTASSSQTVIVNPAPTVTVGNNGPLCPGNTLNLNSTGGGTYTWTGPGGFTSTQQNPSIPNTTISNAGTYIVTVTSTAGCTATANTTVSISSSLAVTASSNMPVCEGSTLTLSTSGGTVYSWIGPGGFSSSSQNPNIPNASSANNGTYTVTVTNASGCTGSATINITVEALPIVSASNNSPICLGGTINLSATGGTTYSWTGPSGFNSSLQNPSIASANSTHDGVYVVTVGNAAGCTASASTTVIVGSSISVTADNNSPICSGETILLSATGGVDYNWSGPGGFSSNDQNPSITNAGTSSNGTYTVTITDVNGCKGTATTIVTVSDLPSIIVGSNLPICQGEALMLNVSGGIDYNWSGPNGYSSTEQNPVINDVTTQHNGTYIVTVSNAAGCTASASVDVTVNPLPQVNFTGMNLTGCTPVCVDFSDMTTISSGNITNWTWSANGTTFSNVQHPTQCFSTPGTYDVSLAVTSAQGCSASYLVADMVTVYSNPEAGFTINPTELVLNEPTAHFTSNSTGDITSWHWDFGDGSTGDIENPIHMYGDTGTYCISLTVSSSQGCSSSATHCLTVYPEFYIYIPNSFTPNGDMINDFFTAEGIGIATFEMEIFNRWGESIYETDNMVGWPGTIGTSEDMAQQGVYVYKIWITTFQDDELDFIGHVNLLR